MRRPNGLALGLVLGLLALVLGGCGGSVAAEGPEVAVNINHSRFAPEELRVESGTTVRFLIHNRDPIDHEFILGNAAVQDRHENGTHAEHDAVPGEISVPAGTTRSTSYTFAAPGRLIIGCHLPAHYDYGMRADVIVLD
jgi:uncharacterized cupredoxin-like copper-binding protein